MSAIASGLAALSPTRTKTQCQTCTYLAGLDDEDRAALVAKLDGEPGARVSARELADFLAPHGGPTRRSIEAHRLARHG
jgi:hypothetical protein